MGCDATGLEALEATATMPPLAIQPTQVQKRQSDTAKPHVPVQQPVANTRNMPIVIPPQVERPVTPTEQSFNTKNIRRSQFRSSRYTSVSNIDESPQAHCAKFTPGGGVEYGPEILTVNDEI